jgi:hypothetical protein
MYRNQMHRHFSCAGYHCVLHLTISSSWWGWKIGDGTGGRTSNRDRRIFDRNGIRMIWRTEELTNSGFNAPEQFPHFSPFMGDRTGSVPRHSTVDSTGSTLPVCPWPCGRGPMSYSYSYWTMSVRANGPAFWN